jgi:toxin FitB
MIVLDTNVLSEVLRPLPDEHVLRWLEKQDRDLVFTTAVTQAEILYGVEMLPAGRRRNRLHSAVERLFADEFHGRILPFDAISAIAYPKIVSARERMGRPISQFDAVIASICQSRNASIATRNIGDFEQCGLEVIDPWSLA